MGVDMSGHKLGEKDKSYGKTRGWGVEFESIG